MEAPRIAIVARSDSFCEVWPQVARFAGATLEVAPTPGEIRLIQSTCGVLVAAGGVEDEAGQVIRDLAAARAPEAVVAGAETNHRVVASLFQAGAANYFALPMDLGACRSWMAERVQRMESRRNGDRFAADERVRFDFSKMIGSSTILRAALNRTARIIPKGASTILITGETGTGKELLARAVHYNGPRATGPFVEVNCTTLPENLLEAELFGYEPGAFTDARTAKPGLFEVANGGTLFLDEIGDLPVTLQAKLLRVLEDRKVRRLGSVREVEFDIRLITATNVDLPTAVRRGTFREDLYYRLNVVPIHLPALRDRGDDILQLTEHFIERFCREYGLPLPTITPDIRRALLSHMWPGNVRELRNSVERAVLLGDGHIFSHDLFPDEARVAPPKGLLPFPAPLSDIEEAAARAMVHHCGGNKSEAAKVLGVSRKHLYTLLSRDGLSHG